VKEAKLARAFFTPMKDSQSTTEKDRVEGRKRRKDK
jgi:hypothetical protein